MNDKIMTSAAKKISSKVAERVRSIPLAWKVATTVVLGTVVVATVARTTGDPRGKTFHRTIAKRVPLIVSDSIRWYNTSEQDHDALTKLQHCLYATAFIKAAKHICSDQDIQRLTGVCVEEYINTLEQKRIAVTRLLSSQFPGIEHAS